MSGMRKIILCICSILLMLNGRAFSLAGRSPEKKMPNVLLITIDTLRADKLGCYGNLTIKTPNINAAAKEGLLFARAFAHNPLTLPSHTNIMLGMTPLHHGVHDNVNFVVREEYLTLPEHLKKFGYATGAVIGACPLDSRFGLNQGFDFYEDDFKTKGKPKNTPAERRGDEVIRLAQTWLSQQKGSWFLWMHIFDPHYPYTPPEPFMSQYKDKPYNGEVAYVDSLLGGFFQYLKDQKLKENTLMILTADHGESLGDHGEVTHGMFAYNATIWCPLIISLPGGQKGKNIQTVAQTDIYPTICDVLGIPIPKGLQGISLKPALKGKKLPSRTFYFESLEAYYSYDWAPIRGYLNDSEKFIDSPIPEAYDLQSDFQETRNLAATSSLKRHRNKLNKLMEGLSDPDSGESKTLHDHRTIERLRSLGYTNFSAGRKQKTNFGPKDDIKTLLPLYNKAMEAVIIAEEGKIEDGLEILRKIISRGARIYQPYIFLSDILADNGRKQEAISALEEGNQKFPNSFGIVNRLIRLLNDVGRYDQAIEIFYASDFIQMEQEPRLWYSLGRAFVGKGDLRNAVSALNQAIEIDAKYADGYALLGKAYLLQSQEKEDNALYSAALENIGKALALNPDHSQALLFLGLAHIESGEYETAIANLMKSLRGENPDPKAYFYLGQSHLGLNQKSQALHYFTNYADDFLPLLNEDEKNNFAVYMKLIRPAKKKLN